jgi:RNA polymerase sigma-70 factor (ECF subfamily)
MGRADPLQQMVEAYESLVWECAPEQLKSQETSFAAEFSLLGCRVEDALGEMSDESLVLAAQKGFFRAQALTVVFDRYERPLFHWFFRWGARSDDAEDLRQAVYVKILKSVLRLYRPVEGSSRNWRSYLWITARRLFLELRRKKKPGSLNGIPERPDHGPGPEQLAVEKELHERFETALPRLPTEEQLVLRSTVEGRSADTIAAENRWPKSTVFRLLFRARRRIEQELGLPRRCGASGRAAHG